MNRFAVAAAAAALAVGAATAAFSGSSSVPPDSMGIMNPMIGGQAMMPGATIYANAVNSPEHSRLVAALKTSGLKQVLERAGSYTIFAPTDRAFADLKDSKAASPRYLVVKGRWDSQALLARINENGGKADLATLDGHRIVAMMNGPTNIALMDETGATANIAIYDIYQSNGVMQVIDRVMLPRQGAGQIAGL